MYINSAYFWKNKVFTLNLLLVIIYITILLSMVKIKFEHGGI